jgi:urocanate reductase
MNRRTFIAGSVAGGATLVGASMFGLGGIQTATAAAAVPSWDQTADVVIVGGGGSALAASIEAAGAGASVLILEKAARTGGNTGESGGVIQAAGTTYQKQYTKYQNDTPEKHYECWLIEGEGLIDPVLIKDQAYGAPANLMWLVSLGVVVTGVYGHCHVPYLDKAGIFADRIHVTQGGGAAMGACLLKGAQAAGVTIQTSTTVTKLVTDGTNGVVGVLATGPNGSISVGANRGVIIAAGSFDHNQQMAKALSAQQYWALTTQSSYTVVTNTGDGIRMGMEGGAALAGMGGTIDIDLTTGLGEANNAPQLAGVYVNAQGKRFVCEDSTYAYQMRAVFQQYVMHQQAPYLVVDSVGVQSAASPWSGTKLATALSSGVLVRGSSLADLAKQMKVPAANLSVTMAEWNKNIATTGKDPVFLRNTGLVPIDTPPFYAYKPSSNNLGSIGGLKIDVQTRVIDQNGNAIPHLYAAGLASGGWIGPYYPGSGTALSGVAHWGRKAGVSAAGSL